MKFSHMPVCFLILIACGSQVIAQTNWPQFRGADSRGVGSGGNLPDRWSATENVAWKTDIPGRGWSSPIVWGNKIFLTTVVNLGESEPPKKGLYFGGDRPKPADAHCNPTPHSLYRRIRRRNRKSSRRITSHQHAQPKT